MEGCRVGFGRRWMRGLDIMRTMIARSLSYNIWLSIADILLVNRVAVGRLV